MDDDAVFTIEFVEDFFFFNALTQSLYIDRVSQEYINWYSFSFALMIPPRGPFLTGRLMETSQCALLFDFQFALEPGPLLFTGCCRARLLVVVIAIVIDSTISEKRLAGARRGGGVA